MRRFATVVLVLFLLFACFVVEPGTIVLPFYVLFGWGEYLYRVLPEVKVSWPATFSALVCLLGVLCLGHVFARWIWRETAGQTSIHSSWKPRWTLTAATIVVLMFTAGIAAVGVTHQTTWLFKSDIYTYGGRSREAANRVKCGSHLRQIGQAMLMYANDNGGRYPDSFEHILLTQDITGEVFCCPSTGVDRAPGETPEQQAANLHKGHCSYVYHARGLKSDTPATRPIACELLYNHDGAGMNILFGDGHVEFVTAAEAKRLLDALPR